jgi:hypothetical protein
LHNTNEPDPSGLDEYPETAHRPPSDTSVDATLLSRRFIHAGDWRELLLGLKAGKRIAAEAKLMRGFRTIRKRVQIPAS